MNPLISKHGMRLAALVVLALLTISANAQQETAATLTGRVSDATGAVIAGANVVITNQDNGAERQVKTSNEGSYVAAPLIPGRYTITVEGPGFKKYVQKDVVLNVSDRRQLNIALEAGLQTEV